MRALHGPRPGRRRDTDEGLPLAGRCPPRRAATVRRDDEQERGRRAAVRRREGGPRRPRDPHRSAPRGAAAPVRGSRRVPARHVLDRVRHEHHARRHGRHRAPVLVGRR